MLPPGTRVIAAVSGGADSVALLHILRELAPESLVGIAHINHQLRAEESDADEQFVSTLAATLHLPYHCLRQSVDPGNLEQNARRARQEFFRSLIASAQADRIALAHTLDDQAETVLFRILRGSGLSGLAGILPVTAEGIIRPLLNARREDLRAFLRDRGIRWREDSSNQSPQFARNRIRQTLLPALQRDWNPQISEALAHLGDVAYEEEVWWATEAAQYESGWLTAPGSVEIHIPALAALPRALVRRLLRHAMRRARGDLRGIDYSHIEAAAGLLGQIGSARISLPGVTVVRSFDWLLLRVSRPTTPEPLPVPRSGTYSWPSSNPLIYLDIDLTPQRPQACDTLDLELRGWRPGDQYRPRGYQHAVKVKELFQSTRVPSWRRASWPMITRNGKILWAKEFGLATEASGLKIREIPISPESFDLKPTS